MKSHDQFLNPEVLQTQFLTTPQEPVSTCNENKHTVEILDAKFEKADVAKIISINCMHLSDSKQNSLVTLLLDLRAYFTGP